MLIANVDGHPPGHTFALPAAQSREYRVHGWSFSTFPLDRIEIVVNGEIVRTVRPANEPTVRKAFASSFEERIPIDGTSWIAIRCFEDRADKRIRFAHSGPVHIDVPGKSLRPRKAEIDFLISRVKEQLARNEGVLPPESIDEYRQALAAYEAIANRQ
jgi:hypothetical protein